MGSGPDLKSQHNLPSLSLLEKPARDSYVFPVTGSGKRYRGKNY